MRILYGEDFKKRYRIVSEEIGTLSVLDVCCGDSFLANYVASDKYCGIDINRAFVAHGRKRGLRLFRADVVKDAWPRQDCVVMLASLYQFIPHHEDMLKKALSFGQKKVVISEPVNNLADSKNPVIAWLASYSTYPGIESSRKRFNRGSLTELYKKYNASRIIDAGRDLIGIFDIKKQGARLEISG